MKELISATKQLYDFYSEKKLSPKTVENYSNAVRQYMRFIGGKQLEMGFDSVIQWLNTIETARTYNLNLQGIKAYFLKFFENEPAEKVLELERGFKKIKRKKPKTDVDNSKFITLEEFDKLISVNTVDKLRPFIRKRNELHGYTNKNLRRTGLFIQSLFWTGCRISELLDIKLKDCSVNGTVGIKIRNGKGGKEHLVYLQKQIFEAIRKEFDGETYLFETRAGSKFNRLNVTKDIHRFAWKVIRRKISAHSLRHSKAMYLKQVKNLSADQIAKALHHSSVVTTLQFYFHGSPTPEEMGIE